MNKKKELSFDSVQAVYQVFCGLNVVSSWRCPDHTKIEEFRNRLSAETHKSISDYIVNVGVKLGFGDPSRLDIDSTVQESSMPILRLRL